MIERGAAPRVVTKERITETLQKTRSRIAPSGSRDTSWPDSGPSAGDLTPSTWFGGRLPYLQIRTRFVVAMICGLLWASLSTYLALPWFNDLGELISLPLAIAVIGGIAILPGYLTAFLITSLVLDRPRQIKATPPGRERQRWPGMTLLIAAFDEEARIGETIEYALASDYPGRLRVIIADDGSNDQTAEIVQRMSGSNNGSGRSVELLRTEHSGKAASLNAALAGVRTDLLATIDADTLLGHQSLKRATARLISSIEGTDAVAGAVMARNSRTNFLTSLQEWDYQLGIASIKRSQAIWQSTLVSQGSFSVYRTKAVRAAGGWPDSIGEDIVLTWALLADGATVGFEPTALAFTEVPSRLGRLARQRARWARGMIEGLKAYGFRILRQRRMASHGIAINLLFPWMDLCYTFAFLPGIVLACTGNFAIVGPLTLAVLPLNLLLSGLMLRMQRHVFDEVHLTLRRNPIGFLSYLLFYQPLMSPMAVAGYVQETFRRPRTW